MVKVLEARRRVCCSRGRRSLEWCMPCEVDAVGGDRALYAGSGGMFGVVEVVLCMLGVVEGMKKIRGCE